jgi:hypothetical protein
MKWNCYLQEKNGDYIKDEDGHDIQAPDIKIEVHEERSQSKRPYHTGSPRNKKTKVYVGAEDGSVMNSIVDRMNGIRPDHKFFRKHIMPRALRLAGLPEDTKFSWSRYAGCTCPCSPGFIIEEGLGCERWPMYSPGREIWVTFDFSDYHEACKKREEEARERIQSV